MRYQQNREKEVGVIAHSCGAAELRQLRREHCRVVQGNGRSVPLDELYPPGLVVNQEAAELVTPGRVAQLT